MARPPMGRHPLRHRPAPARPESGPRPAHACVALRPTLQRQRLDHRPDPGQHAEPHRVPGVRRRAGQPAGDGGAPADQLERRDLDRVGGGTHDQELAVHPQAIGDGAHRLVARCRGQDHARAAHLAEDGGGVDRAAVQVAPRPEPERQLLLVGAARDRDGVEAELIAGRQQPILRPRPGSLWAR